MPQHDTKRRTIASITSSKMDKDFLKKTVYELSRLDIHSSQSELYALGVSLLRDRSPETIQKLLRRERTR